MLCHGEPSESDSEPTIAFYHRPGHPNNAPASPEIVAAFKSKWDEVVVEESAKSESFKKVWASYSKFRSDYAIWREHGYMT